MTTLRPRATIYAGTPMRSRLEAAFAQWLDAKGWRWQYEPVCFASPAGQYLPDFFVDDGTGRSGYFDVKPSNADHLAALERMHIIRASLPTVRLYVAIRPELDGDFQTPARCLQQRGCSWCR